MPFLSAEYSVTRPFVVSTSAPLGSCTPVVSVTYRFAPGSLYLTTPLEWSALNVLS